MEHIAIKGLSNPFARTAASLRERHVRARFGMWLGDSAAPIAVLGLSAFVAKEPLSYIADDVLQSTLDVLEASSVTTLRILKELDLQLTHAVSSLLREGSSWSREHRLQVDTPARLREFEQVWHPEYQRYAEHVYNHLISVPLGILGELKKKEYLKARLAVRIDALNQNNLGELTRGFDRVVRNAISHGTTVYGTHAIKYIDSKVVKDLTPNAVGKLFDNLVETCHGMIAAILIWVARHWIEIEQIGTQALPGGVRRLLVQGAVEHPGFAITSVIEADFPVQLSQANVYCTSSTRSRVTHLIEALYTAAAMVQFGKADTQTILVHIDCGASVPSLATVKTAVVKKILDEGFSELLAKEAFEGSFMWHDASAVSQRLWTYRTSAKLAWARMKEEIVSDSRERGLEVWGSRYKLKEVRYGRRRIDVEVVLTGIEPVTKHLIRGVLQHATTRLRRVYVPANEDTGLRVPQLPLYVCFRLHARNRNMRILGSDGWRDPDLLAQAEWRARKTLEALWVKLPDENYRGVLIRYNPDHRELPEGEPSKLRVPAKE